MENKELREDLQELKERQKYLYDDQRSEVVEERRSKGRRTIRENIEDLCDADSFVEMGSLIVAGQSGRRSHQQLIEETPADGLITGIGDVNKEVVGSEHAKCIILGYDYMVLAGTQGGFSHKKTDRMMALAEKTRRPIVFFVEGGGGRPGDIDFDRIAIGGLDLMTFVSYARLSGLVPRVAIVAGYCFAGNAAIAGCSDVIIATEQSNIGMGGPAMIEGGGLGKYHPKDIGPAKIQSYNGVIDILVSDEVAAVQAAKKYLSFFQGATKGWEVDSQEVLREMIPTNRRFGYDVRKIITLLSDKDAVLELRAHFAPNLITAFTRIEGRAMGVMANSPRHLGGAIDGKAADKASRFMQLCDAFDLPILSLCDVPGFMVGPECEAEAMVRHASRMYVVGASITTPIITVVLRKAYGLGAMAMAGGSLHQSLLTVSWPTGEFGPMGLEGAVKLGFKKDLEAIDDIEQRNTHFQELVRASYDRGKAIAAASKLEFDEVIDPMDTRRWITTALACWSPRLSKGSTSRYIDTW